jgi:hypothetical protein
MKKRDLKALRTTYRTHPEVFDSEPAGLLSNADRDEDNMVSVSFVQVLHVTHNYIIVFGPQCTYKTGTHIQCEQDPSNCLGPKTHE